MERCNVAVLQLITPETLSKNVGWPKEIIASQAQFESIAYVVNLKLLKIAVGLTKVRLIVGFSSRDISENYDSRSEFFRGKMPWLYTDLWDLSLACDNAGLSCTVLTQSTPQFLKEYAEKASRDVDVVYFAGDEIDTGYRSDALRFVSLQEELQEEIFGVSYLLYDNPAEKNLPCYPKVVVGGTFDRFHNGHKKLLTACCALATEEIVCGISGEAMLSKKSNGHLIESFETRRNAVVSFIRNISPRKLRCEPVEINDAFGPSVTIDDLKVIVVSTEVLGGARQVNEERIRRGMRPLIVVAVARSQLYSLSSTFIRQLTKTKM